MKEEVCPSFSQSLKQGHLSLSIDYMLFIEWIIPVQK